MNSMKGSALALLYGWSDQNLLVEYTHMGSCQKLALDIQST